MASKKRICLFLGIFLLMVIIGVYAYNQSIPDPGHGGDKVLVTINDYTMTLQEAIDRDFLVDGCPEPTQNYTTEISGAYHTAEDILVSINGAEMTLQDVLSFYFSGEGCGGCPWGSSFSPAEGYWHCSLQDNLGRYDSEGVWTDWSYASIAVRCNEPSGNNLWEIKKGLCGSSSVPYAKPAPNPGHYANETWILINDKEMSLQDAIDGGKFCSVCVPHTSSACYDHDAYWYDSCGNRGEKKEECRDCWIIEGYGGCSSGSDYIRVHDCLYGGCYSHDQCYSSIPDVCLGRIS